jgi:hypothetical protein
LASVREGKRAREQIARIVTGTGSVTISGRCPCITFPAGEAALEHARRRGALMRRRSMRVAGLLLTIFAVSVIIQVALSVANGTFHQEPLADHLVPLLR